MTKDFYIKTSMNREQIKEKMVSAMDLPKDVIQNASVITILGRNELCIENYRGIIEYTDTLIRVQTRVGQIRSRENDSGFNITQMMR